MSDWSEKTEQRRPSVGGRAQATRRDLVKRRGSAEQGVDVITVDTMDGREVWRRITGDKGSAGDFFEQEVGS